MDSKKEENKEKTRIKKELEKIKNNKIYSKAITIILSIILMLSVYYNSFLPRYNAAKFDFIKENLYYNCISKLGPAGEIKCMQLVEKEGNQLVKIYEDFYTGPEGRYLVGIDPYYYYRLTKNLITQGHYYEILKDYDINADGKLEKVPYDDKQYSPPGHPMENKPPFIVELESFIYKIITKINPNLEGKIMGIIFWIPAFIAPISAIFAYLIGSLLFNQIIGLMFGLFMVFNTTFLSRSIAGFADTDYLNITLPLIALYFFLLAFYSNNKIKKVISYLLSSITLGIFAWTWTGWWYIFWVILVFIGIKLLKESFEFYKNNRRIEKTKLIKSFIKEKKGKLIEYSLFFIASFIFISLFSSISTFFTFISSPIKILINYDKASSGYWPNTLLTVAEANDVGGFKGLINQVFSIGSFNMEFLAWFGIFGAILLIIDIIRKKRYELLAIIFWLLAAIAYSLQGVRFLMYLAVPLTILASYFIYRVVEIVVNILFDKKEELIRKVVKISLNLVIIFVILLKGSFIYHAFHSVGEFNDNWYKVMEFIKNKDYDVITSWWDFGHYFIAMTKKKVTFDGASQTTPRAFWVGKALQSNETLAKGIITMLTTTGDKAFDFIITYLSAKELNYSEKEALDIAKIRIKEDKLNVRKYFENHYNNWDKLYFGTFNGTAIGVNLILEILPLNKTKALEKLIKGVNIQKINKTIKLPKEVATILVNLTFPKNPNKVAFIVSEDMVGKAGAWGALGNWDFFNPPKTKEEFYKLAKFYIERNMKKIEENKLVTWFDFNGNKVVDQNDLVFKLITKTNNETKENISLYLFNQKVEFYYFDKENKKFEKIKGNKTNNDILIIKDKDNYKLIIMNKGMINSLFTKAWFLEGYGLKYFKKVYVNPANPKIIVYSLN